MFFVWMIMALVAAVCTSAIESVARSSEKLTQEKYKKIDIVVAVSALLTVLLFMIGYYRVQQDPDLFGWGELIPESLLNYAMLFSGIYGMITLLIAAIPYAIRKVQECRLDPKAEEKEEE